MTRMWHRLVGAALLMFAVATASGQVPVLGSIETPHANLQNSVTMAGVLYGKGAVAYGPIGTPIVLSGSNLGTTGSVTFIPYKNGVVDVAASSVQATVAMWSSNMLTFTVPTGALTGLVKVTTAAGTSNGLPFLVTQGSYIASCPAGPTSSQLQITTSSLHNGSVGQAYSATLGATGGTTPYTWSITSGTLPAGLSLSASSGTISGTATAGYAPTNVTFEVTDNSTPKQSDYAVLSVAIESQSMNAVDIYGYVANSYDGAGDLTSYSDTVMGTWGLSYDTLNRLAGASINWPNASQQYACWNYDHFGNRKQQEVSSATFTSPSGGANLCTPQSGASVATDLASYSGNNNQISSTNARGVTATPIYDAAGDMTSDGVNTYLYDAEGQVCAVNNGSVAGISVMTGYLYDADGVRVAKGTLTQFTCDLNPADATYNGFQFSDDYVLGSGDEELTQFHFTSGAGAWQRTNVYAAGKLLATYDASGLHFHLTDPLGTRRMQLSGSAANLGQPEIDIQSLPFGDQLTSFADPYASQAPNDASPLHFTGKERDAESGLDFFGARYYASSMGRWMSPDWSAKADPVPYAKLADPQTLNLYSYVANNPLSRFDNDGHEIITVQLRAYIPQANVGPYRGDNRGPTASQTVNSRTAITLTIETDPSKSANPLLYNSGGIAGTTHNDVTGNFATQTVGLPTAQVSRDANGNVVINIQQNAANPLTPAAVTPGIQSNVTVGVPVNGSSVTTSGTVSGAPAFELNVQTPGNSTTNIPLQSNPPSNPIAFGAALTQTNQLPTKTTPLPPPQ